MQLSGNIEYNTSYVALRLSQKRKKHATLLVDNFLSKLVYKDITKKQFSKAIK